MSMITTREASRLARKYPDEMRTLLLAAKVTHTRAGIAYLWERNEVLRLFDALGIVPTPEEKGAQR